MTKIIHNKFPIENGRCVIPLNWQEDIHNYIIEAISELDEKYVVISTPTELSCINDNDVILTIDAKKYTYTELKEIIEKANNYENLCN